MKIKLNLLPKSREKKIRNKKILKFIILQEVMIMIVTICLFGLILGVKNVAKIRLGEAEQQISSVSNSGDYVKIKKYEDSIKLTKARTDVISKIQKNNVNWISVMSQLSEILPPTITLKSLKNVGYSFIVSGEAESRDALVQMKQGFEGNKCFSDIDIPLNDIVLKSNIEFELKFNVNKECLKLYEK